MTLAVAMLVGTAITGTLTAPYAAYADNTNSGSNEAGLCTPTNINLGDDITNSTTDTGVATYVGRDMYIGANLNNAEYLEDGNAPDGSYAVEAEGLTVVNGKLAMNPLNNSWRIKDNDGNLNSAGFRFGTVGFGAQFRPKSGPALVVGGQNSGIKNMRTGNVNNTNVGAWTKGAWTGQSAEWASKDNYTVNTSSPAYTSQIVGTMGKWQSDSTDNKHDAVVGQQGHWYKDANSDSKSYSDAMKVTGTSDDNTSYTNDYSSYNSTIDTLSKTLALGKTTADATEDTDGSKTSLNGVWRGKYNWDVSNTWASYKFEFNGGQSEKVIKFNGDNKSSMQFFNLPASMLSGDQGISFEFTNIPDNASVVINVTGANNGPIGFHNGWRVWWNGTDVSDGYRKNADSTIASKYAHAAQAVMWNFADASKVTIYGGKGTGRLTIANVQQVDINEHGATNNGTYDNVTTTDDPAAAFLGSILVPKGSLESHVSTNGRVWVGVDFSMYNPESATIKINGTELKTSEGKTTSVINMDQERHNLPWSGNFTRNCAVIGWNKIDANTQQKIGGSEWGIYKSEADAKANQNALLVVDDNGSNDSDYTEGVITVRNLMPNATYYIKELKAPDNYIASDTVYEIKAGAGGETIYKPTAGEDIENTPSGASVRWAKYENGDTNKTPLPGSEWQLTKKGANGSSDETWTIKDNTRSLTKVDILNASTNTDAGATYSMSQSSSVHFKARITYRDNTTTDNDSDVTWTSSDETVASVTADGVVIAKQPGTTVIKATAVADDTKFDSITVTVSSVSVTGITIKNGNQVVAANSTLEMAKNGTLQLDAVVESQNGTTVSALWESSDPDVATVTANGLIKAVSVGVSTITVYAGDKQTSVVVRVTDSTETLVYVKKSVVLKTYPNWGNDYYIGYGRTGAAWSFVKMTASECNDDWMYVTVPRQGNDTAFKIVNQGNSNAGGSWYPAGTGSDIKFNSRAVIVLDGSNSAGTDDMPDCTVRATTRAATTDELNAQADVADGIAEADADVQSADGAETTVDAQSDEKAAAYDCTAAGFLCDIDPASGMFRVKDLTDGTYELKETVAPNGYTLNTTVYKFTVTNGVPTWDNGQQAGLVNDVMYIDDKPTEVTWYKQDAKHSFALAGSQWKIQLNGGTAVYCVADDNAAIDTKACSGTKLDDTASDAGTITVKKLPKGTYTLTEVVAPTGYDKLSDSYTFMVDDSNTTVQIGNLNGNKIDNSLTPVEAKIPVTKNVTGGSWPTGSDGQPVTFQFKLEKYGTDTQQAIPTPTNCANKSEADIEKGVACVIDVKPDATGKITANGMFSGLHFNANNLGSDATKNYARTYTYKITEVKPENADSSIEYSQAGYKVVVTVEQIKSGDKWGALKVSYSMVRMTDDSNTKVNGEDGTEVGTWASDGSHQGTAGGSAGTTTSGTPVATFTNKIYGPELPATGGEGTAMFLRAGTFAVIVATAGMALMVRRQRR
ncbi:Ig-like domain-containing protein [Bifidobacterium sp. 81T8]|nr:SpaA isopeptide-forming pilin-related protein [Bifidobacterium simiiventris]MBW3079161.1 Ig-like domain-containing protein [Bifidobacterium simiiventris]